MPRTVEGLTRNVGQEKERAKRYLRRCREVYVATRLRKVLSEEATLMLAFANAKELGPMLQAHAALIRHRLLVLRMIGWPKEPAYRGPMPRCLDGIGNHNPMADIDVSAIADPEPVAEG